MAKRSIEDIRADVARATVKLLAKGGQGVLVKNGRDNCSALSRIQLGRRNHISRMLKNSRNFSGL
jgi:hypothetical protein